MTFISFLIFKQIVLRNSWLLKKLSVDYSFITGPNKVRKSAKVLFPVHFTNDKRIIQTPITLSEPHRYNLISEFTKLHPTFKYVLF